MDCANDSGANRCEAIRSWPKERLGELLDHLGLGLKEAGETQVQEAWRQEIRRRLAEVESAIDHVPGEEVSARIRKIVGR